MDLSSMSKKEIRALEKQQKKEAAIRRIKAQEFRITQLHYMNDISIGLLMHLISTTHVRMQTQIKRSFHLVVMGPWLR